MTKIEQAIEEGRIYAVNKSGQVLCTKSPQEIDEESKKTLMELNEQGKIHFLVNLDEVINGALEPDIDFKKAFTIASDRIHSYMSGYNNITYLQPQIRSLELTDEIIQLITAPTYRLCRVNGVRWLNICFKDNEYILHVIPKKNKSVSKEELDSIQEQVSALCNDPRIVIELKSEEESIAELPYILLGINPRNKGVYYGPLGNMEKEAGIVRSTAAGRLRRTAVRRSRKPTEKSI